MLTSALGCYSRVKSITMCKNVSCYSYLLLCQRSVPPTGSAASTEAKLSALHNTRSELISCKLQLKTVTPLGTLTLLYQSNVFFLLLL